MLIHMSKSSKETTFREYLQNYTKEKSISYINEEMILKMMHEEGFTNEEIYNLPVVQVLNYIKQFVLDQLTSKCYLTFFEVIK